MENYIEYIVFIDRLVFNGDMNFNVEYEKVEKVTIIQDKSRFTHIRFFLDKSVNKDEAKKITELPLDDILNNIAFNVENVVVSEFTEVRFPNQGSSSINCCVMIRQPKQEEQIIDSIIKIEDGLKYVNVKHKLFRAAMLSKDSVARFINLYGIIYMIEGSQDKVDNYIDSIKDEMGITIEYKDPHPHSRRANSTEYTHYRNKVAHMEQDIDYDKLRRLSRDIDRVLPNFIKIIKRAIEDNIR